MNLPWDDVTLEDICAEIADNKVSSIARYGDGEFYWIIGVPGFVNRGTRGIPGGGGHETIKAGSEEMRRALLDFAANFGGEKRRAGVAERTNSGEGADELRQTLFAQPRYRLAGPLFFRNYGSPEREKKWKAIEVWIRENHLEHLRWCSNLLFVKGMIQAARERRVFSILEHIRPLTTVVVGPPWLRALKTRGVLNYNGFIDVPAVNCYREIDRIEAQMLDYHATLPGPVFFSLSCCYTANLLVHRLYDRIGDSCWLFDLGSVWEPYVGYRIRGYHGQLRGYGELIT